jgi:hypothetical protein
MRSLLVAEAADGSRLALLPQVARCRLCCLGLQFLVHPLVNAVVIGVAGVGEHRLDPPVHEPRRKPRQP